MPRSSLSFDPDADFGFVLSIFGAIAPNASGNLDRRYLKTCCRNTSENGANKILISVAATEIK